MASIRELKKDIKVVSSELIMQSMMMDFIFDENKTDSELLNKVLTTEARLVKAINDYRTKKSEVKAKEYFNGITKEFKTLIDEIINVNKK